MLGILFLVVPAVHAASAHAAAIGSKPHILHVIVDDFGWGNSGYNRAVSDPEVSTPHMDALANDGIILRRHYVHSMCTPTRVSFQTGRLPVHSGQSGLCSPTSINCGIPYNATVVSQKLSAGGYDAHFVGKWDCGMATPKHTPFGRDYASSLTYFGHGNYQWGQAEWGDFGGGKANNTVVPACGDCARDLWQNNKPAQTLANASRDNGIYEEALFLSEITKIVENHDVDIPLFLVYASRIAHYPVQAPASYQLLPHIASIDMPHRRVYHAQIQYLDDQLGNITSLFKAKGLWDKTLMVLHADNGGYTKELGSCTEFDPVMGVTCMTGEAGANNYPLRGGKYSFFEGGIRANSFVSGGMLPASVRGTVSHSMIHVSDWYVTYSLLAGVDPHDTEGEAAGVPAVDGYNVLPVLFGSNTTSPRTEIWFAKGVLMQGDWKLLTTSISSASWAGPTYPNKSSVGNTLDQYTAECSDAKPCLYNVGQKGDYTEHAEYSSQEPAIVAKMKARMATLLPTLWSNKWLGFNTTCQDEETVRLSKYNGFYGPFCAI